MKSIKFLLIMFCAVLLFVSCTKEYDPKPAPHEPLIKEKTHHDEQPKIVRGGHRN